MVDERIVIIGAGMGGLAAAAWLAVRGRRVLVLEARQGPGGLAAGFSVDGRPFDAGPYILLDRLGLEWAFNELGEDLSSHITLRRLRSVYEVRAEGSPTVRVLGSLEETASEIDERWPGAGGRYTRFVRRMGEVYGHLRPLQYTSQPGPRALLQHHALGQTPFLLRPLSAILKGSGLPKEVTNALAIWTHVAGQKMEEAPSPLAFVPALIHQYGAYLPEGGIGQIPLALEKLAIAAGAEFRYGVRVRRICCRGGKVTGVEIDGEEVSAQTVISNAGAIGTYLHLLRETPQRFREQLKKLPLQSPGVCAYLAVGEKEGAPQDGAPYLKFLLPRQGLCRLLIQPGAVDSERAGTARLLGPLNHAWAQRVGPTGQHAYLDKLLAEDWWREDFTHARALAHRTPAEWGEQYNLYKDSMNPVMTARMMLKGRVPHRSALVEGLYFAGSSTHPGQWVSFCAISGILAARSVAC